MSLIEHIQLNVVVPIIYQYQQKSYSNPLSSKQVETTTTSLDKGYLLHSKL